MKKKIVFVNQASGYLTIDIVNAFADNFDIVALISTEIRVQDVELDNRVQLHKTIRHSRKSNFHRITRWVLSAIHIFFLLLTKYRKYEIFYISIPPMAYFSSIILPNKFSILIYDVYPDVLSLFGIKPTNPIYMFWSWANKKIFVKAHKIFTISEVMKKQLLKYTSEDKIKVIYNWTGITDLNPVEKKSNPFVLEHKLLNKFVVQYSGNISPTHNIETIVHVAERLKHDDNIMFLIIGRGQLVDYIRSLIKKLSLEKTVKMLPFQPDDILKFSLASADLGVVVVSDKSAELSIPSKIYNIQAAGVTILGIGPKASELDKHLLEYNNGSCFEHYDIEGIVNYIQALSKNPSKKIELKNNSIKAAEKFTMKNAKLYLEPYLNQI